MKYIFLLIALLSIRMLVDAQPKSGEIYREFAINLKEGDNWRVTDPNARHSGASAYLPNPVLSINIYDLKDAIRAEVLLDIWGGHVGTIGRQFRFNNHEWINIPMPSTFNSCYHSQFNAIINVPLEHIKEGNNTFQGTSGGQNCYGFEWGQWGWYTMIVRIYYTEEKPHTEAKIALNSGDTIKENSILLVEANDTAAVSLVQLLGHYQGYDENGDGIYEDWHGAYHSPYLTGHIGSSSDYPYEFKWDTHYVPDQKSNALSFMARIKDTNGVWYVTEIVDSLSLIRNDSLSVKMFTAIGVPTHFNVRAGNTKLCYVNIDTLYNAVDASLFHRTWNAADDEVSSGTIDKALHVNNDMYKCYGSNHFYALSRIPLAISGLEQGNNRIRYTSNTIHHGIEVLWPGPAIIVRYLKEGGKVADPTFSPENNYTFQEAFYPVIKTETEGAFIYYTTDGANPTVSDNRYRASLVVNNDVTIKVRAFKNDYHESNVVSINYFKEPTSIFSNFNADKESLIYPNPVNNYLRLNITSDFENGNYTIVNLSGKLVKKGNALGNTILVSELENGLYIISYNVLLKNFKDKFIICK